jgi:chromate transporter
VDAEGSGSPLVSMLLYFSVISLTAVGGGVIMLAPDIHRYVVEVQHWITSEQFTAAFTIGQASPGPNMLFVTVIGLQVAGILGAMTATLAIVLPTFLLTMTVVRFIPLRPAGRFGRAVRDGLAPISIGLLAAGGLVLAKAADTGIVQVILTFATIGAVVMTKWNPVWLIAIGAVLGMALQL